jgi:PRD1 phage membrane DNA delivery
MNQIGVTFVTIACGVIGLALFAVAVSKKAQTPQVLQAGGSAFASIIAAAVGPVTGGGSGFGGSTSVGGANQ